MVFIQIYLLLEKASRLTTLKVPKKLYLNTIIETFGAQKLFMTIIEKHFEEKLSDKEMVSLLLILLI